MSNKAIRLDKYLADMKAGTRNEVKILIRKSHVSVNGEIIRDVGYKVSLEDEVALDGVPVHFVEEEYILLNKPSGVLTATADKHQQTVLDLLPDAKRKDLFPVGRLDKDAEGLLLITNDGALAHQLLSPKHHIDKVYYAKIRGRVTEKEVGLFAQGLFIEEGFTALPAKLSILRSDLISEIELTIQEGKFHQVKRMFEAVGMEVLYLKRIAMGNMKLPPDLLPGQYRHLTEQEIEGLKASGTRQVGAEPQGKVEKWPEEEPQDRVEKGQEDPQEKVEERPQEKTEVTPSKQERTKQMFDNIKAVIFDLDGTLVDSMWMWHQIDIEYLGKFGISLPEDLQSCIEGMSFSETAEYFQRTFPAITDDIEQMKSAWNRMAWDKYAHEVPLKPGVFEFLKYLKQRGIKTGIATSNSTELVHTVLKSLGVEGYFDAVHTACEVKAGKPAPDIFLFVADKLGVAAEHCLVFEDICKGIQAGKNAGMRVCAVRDEYSLPMEEEKKRLADYFINTYEDLPLWQN